MNNDRICPTCAGAITGTARMMDSTQAPTHCVNGHTFMRSEAVEAKSSLAEFYDTLRKDLNQMPVKALKIEAAARLIEADKWSQKVTDKVKTHPPEGLFTESADAIARGLKKLHPDLKSAMNALTFYINRAGKNLTNEANLEKAKDKLRKLY